MSHLPFSVLIYLCMFQLQGLVEQVKEANVWVADLMRVDYVEEQTM